MEFVSWCRFRRKFGSLHPGMRTDRAIARAAAYFANAMSSRGAARIDWMDFSPYDAAIEEAREVTNEEVFSFLMGISGAKRGH